MTSKVKLADPLIQTKNQGSKRYNKLCINLNFLADFKLSYLVCQIVDNELVRMKTQNERFAFKVDNFFEPCKLQSGSSSLSKTFFDVDTIVEKLFVDFKRLNFSVSPCCREQTRSAVVSDTTDSKTAVKLK